MMGGCLNHCLHRNLASYERYTLLPSCKPCSCSYQSIWQRSDKKELHVYYYCRMKQTKFFVYFFSPCCVFDILFGILQSLLGLCLFGFLSVFRPFSDFSAFSLGGFRNFFFCVVVGLDVPVRVFFCGFCSMLFQPRRQCRLPIYECVSNNYSPSLSRHIWNVPAMRRDAV